MVELNLPRGKSREDRIKELAEKLYHRGLAMTMSSAQQLAESMVVTEERVQKKFEERKESEPAPVQAAPGTSIKELNQSYQSDGAEELRDRAMNPKPVNVQTYYDTPQKEEFVELDPEMQVNEAAGAPSESPAPEPQAVPEDSPAAAEAATESLEEPVENTAEEYPSVAPEEDHAAEPGDEEIAEAAYPENGSAEAVEEREEALPGEDVAATPAPDTPPVQEDAAPAPVEEASESPSEGAAETADGLSEGEDCPTAPPEADAAASEEPPEADSEEREDLGKKHGVDIGDIFNVNK